LPTYYYKQWNINSQKRGFKLKKLEYAVQIICFVLDVVCCLEHPVLLIEKCLSEMCGCELDMAYVTNVHGCNIICRMVL
jgi:hypothetical protein